MILSFLKTQRSTPGEPEQIRRGSIGRYSFGLGDTQNSDDNWFAVRMSQTSFSSANAIFFSVKVSARIIGIDSNLSGMPMCNSSKIMSHVHDIVTLKWGCLNSSRLFSNEYTLSVCSIKILFFVVRYNNEIHHIELKRLTCH